MNLDQIKREVDLAGYARKYGYKGNGSGKGLCLFHPEQNPSFSIRKGDDGIWRFHCFHEDLKGSIVDLKARMENIDSKDAIRALLNEFGEPKKTPQPAPAVIIREHIYKDAAGQPVFKKIKYKIGQKTEWRTDRFEGGAWRPGMNGRELIPYNLDQFAKHEKAIICEGEKDADTVNGLGLDLFATSAPTGCSSWPDPITRHFSAFKEVTFLYDIGNDVHVLNHAAKLQAAFPNLAIKIATVPGTQREFDISDYLANEPGKADAMTEILAKSQPFKSRAQVEQPKGVFVGSLEEFMTAEIPKAVPLVDPLVFRSGFSMVGGVKGSHKSFFCTQLGLSLAAGMPSFLNCRIVRPAKVLLIQQEISVSFMKERVEKIIRAEQFETGGRFIPITTTGNQLKLIDTRNLDAMKRWIEKYEPELLILDPLSTFHDSEENNSRDQAKIRDVLNRLKASYNIALLIAHHFTSKRNQNDPMAPSEVGGWFRGHSCLTDGADVLICLHRLPGQRENHNLPNAYENYNQVQIQLRNGAWPERFAIEFDDESFLLKPSNVWAEFGRKVLPDQIVTLLEANDGDMKRTDLLAHFSKQGISPTTTKRAINEAINQRLIVEEELPGRGKPLLYKLKGKAGTSSGYIYSPVLKRKGVGE